jgi:BolA protein
MNPMNPTPPADQLQQRLQQVLQPSQLEVIDESHQHHGHAGTNGTGLGTHFRVRITAGAFAGKSAVARHRLVYDALQDFMDQGLHALAIEAQTPQA